MGVLAAATLGFSCGVCLVLILHATLPVAGFVLLLALLPLCIYGREKRTLYLVVALAFLSVSLGIGRALLVDAKLPGAFGHDLRHRIAYEGIVVGDPDVRDNAVRVPVRIREGDAHMTVLLVAPRSASVSVGDTVRITGTFLPPQPFAADGGRTFAYDKYLAVRGITGLVEYGSLTVEKSAP